MNLNFNDFQKQDIKFDIEKLQKAYSEILKIRDFTGPEGISNFGAISLTQIPGDPESIKGHKARGVFWTKPNSSGKEVVRDEMINESAYSEFIDDYKDTYFKEVYDTLCTKYQIGRIRLLWKLPRTTLSWHRDPEPRIHIPIVTNYGARMCVDDVVHHMPADGKVWVTDNTQYHNAFNGGEQDRVHLVATVLNFDMKLFNTNTPSISAI